MDDTQASHEKLLHRSPQHLDPPLSLQDFQAIYDLAGSFKSEQHFFRLRSATRGARTVERQHSIVIHDFPVGFASEY
jgi:hypothetical protein